jgi:tetratricopeptide (TPR) repeat protein
MCNECIGSSSLAKHRGQPGSTFPHAHPSPLVIFSAQAATLCKLARFSEASEAAERATTLAPTWAKGWWRRGVIAEMHKLFVKAYQFYSIAIDLEPKEKTFRKAAESVEKRLKIVSKIETADGKTLPTVDGRIGGIQDAEMTQQPPGTLAWARFCADNPEQTLEVYVPRQQNFPTGTSPTSEQWLNQGLHSWSVGLRDGAASLTITTVQHAYDQYQDLLQQGLSGPVLAQASRQLLGGEPYKIAMQDLVSALGLGPLGWNPLWTENRNRRR